MATLNTVFKEVFSEGLKEEGFVKIKGRQPYIVRVVNGEILHIITCRNEWCIEKECKAFVVLGGIATIYRPAINLTNTPKRNKDWLPEINQFYWKPSCAGYDNEYRLKLMKFKYEKENENAMREVILEALKETKKVMLPVLNWVKDLASCLEFILLFDGVGIAPPNYYKQWKCFKYAGSRTSLEKIDWGENLMLVKVEPSKELDAFYQDLLEMTLKHIDNADCFEKKEIVKQETAKFFKEARLFALSQRKKIYDSPEAYAKALELLEEYKEKNLELLRSYGLKV